MAHGPLQLYQALLLRMQLVLQFGQGGSRSCARTRRSCERSAAEWRLPQGCDPHQDQHDGRHNSHRTSAAVAEQAHGTAGDISGSMQRLREAGGVRGNESLRLRCAFGDLAVQSRAGIATITGAAEATAAACPRVAPGSRWRRRRASVDSRTRRGSAMLLASLAAGAITASATCADACCAPLGGTVHAVVPWTGARRRRFGRLGRTIGSIDARRLLVLGLCGCSRPIIGRATGGAVKQLQHRVLQQAHRFEGLVLAAPEQRRRRCAARTPADLCPKLTNLGASFEEVGEQGLVAKHRLGASALHDKALAAAFAIAVVRDDFDRRALLFQVQLGQPTSGALADGAQPLNDVGDVIALRELVALKLPTRLSHCELADLTLDMLDFLAALHHLPLGLGRRRNGVDCNH
mmetsp:Transcript_35421/g.102266  ORF Transcript_35421/g.102266 Transcript_35421/m.102266 type:complete len:405 (+) Transcript_35421:583-1797(+)